MSDLFQMFNNVGEPTGMLITDNSDACFSTTEFKNMKIEKIILVGKASVDNLLDKNILQLLFFEAV